MADENAKAELDALLAYARSNRCSDLHLSEGLPSLVRQNGALVPLPEQPEAGRVRELILAPLSPAQREAFGAGHDIDTAFTAGDGLRQRINVYHQQGRATAAIRLLNDTIPSLEALGLPPVLSSLAALPRGLVLVTGPTGSGKSTTLAAMIQQINQTRRDHILTIEDPIEYLYRPAGCLIHQREVGSDVESFAAALRSALREDPDILLVGEMRDTETICSALTAAETGHLVFSTLHTTGAVDTVDRIIDAVPGGAQNQVRTQLASVLKGVVTQCLLPRADGRGRVPATEVMIGTDAIASMIRENKCHQIGTSIQAGAALGMHSLNRDLTRLLGEKKISLETARRYTNDRRDLEQYLA